jgi:hypothetical protein
VVDRVDGDGPRVHRTSLNMSHSSGNLRPGLNEPKGYPALLNGAPGPRRQLAGVGRYQRSGPLNTMRSAPTASGPHGELVLLTLS